MPDSLYILAGIAAAINAAVRSDRNRASSSTPRLRPVPLRPANSLFGKEAESHA